MTTVVGVNFVRAGKVYWFNPNGLEIADGDAVIVETVRGMDYGIASGGPIEVVDEMVVQPLRKVLRIATQEDHQIVEDNARKEISAFGIAQEKIDKHKLEMKLVEVEYAFDNSRIVFYFTANGRVDFRELVRDMASVFRARIELRQIGVRDEAKMIGGLGPCGRPICCRQFLADFQPVSIKMAKEQNLSLNPTKISGLCGRLMCCLKYEQDHYECVHKRMPKLGKEVDTPGGVGVVVDVNVLKEQLKVRVQLKDGWEIQLFPFEALEPHEQGERHRLKHIEPLPKEEGTDMMMFSSEERAEEAKGHDAARHQGRDGIRRANPSEPRPARRVQRQEPKEPTAKTEPQIPSADAPKPPQRNRRHGGRRRGGGGPRPSGDAPNS